MFYAGVGKSGHRMTHPTIPSSTSNTSFHDHINFHEFTKPQSAAPKLALRSNTVTGANQLARSRIFLDIVQECNAASSVRHA